MTATTAMVKKAMATAMATATAMVTAIMLPPLPLAMMLMMTAVAFKDGNWTTAIGQQ